MEDIAIKLTFVSGLKEVVLDEIGEHADLSVLESKKDKIYLPLVENIASIRLLRSVSNAYVVRRSEKYHPMYLSNHKSILGDMITLVRTVNSDTFRTFTLSCAGSDSPEVLEIANYITERHKLERAEEADMEIYIGKNADIWEVGVRLTTRPLSVRDYRVANIPGGLNPTVGYAMNSFARLGSARSYLNVCSGSATLLIEASYFNKNMKMVGFDIDSKTSSLAIQNIKKAGLITSVQLKTADLRTYPDFGTFDVITSDLPFGMQIGKGEDLRALYWSFVEYCEKFLNPKGTIVVYTAEFDLLQEVIKKSPFMIHKTLELTVPTSVGAYMSTKIFVLSRKIKE